jgi:hypothetical protein
MLKPPEEPVEDKESTPEAVSLTMRPTLRAYIHHLSQTQTLKAVPHPSPQSLMPPPIGSQGYAAGKRSVGRGDFDQAIRSMREGKRRARPTRPLSKIFLDGASGGGRPQSRMYD